MDSTRTWRFLRTAFTMAAITFSLALCVSAQTEAVLHTFGGVGDGGYVNAGLTFGPDGSLYGTAPYGGDANCGCGVVFKLTPTSTGGWAETKLHVFTGGRDGVYPSGTVTFDAVGNLYGATAGGLSTGNCNFHACGTVFELSPTANGGWRLTTLHTFIGTDGGDVNGGLIFDSGGNLYGSTFIGGTGTCFSILACGTVFRLSPTSTGGWKLTTLHDFTIEKDGVFPSSLVMDAAGNLYGTTVQGGTNTCLSGTCGTVFELSPTSSGAWNKTTLYNFTFGADGEFPYAGLVMDSAGNLYGTTWVGGKYGCLPLTGCGVVFELSQTSSGVWSETVLHSFIGKGGDGGSPTSSVIFGPNGNLYGTASGGGLYGYGTVFELSPSSNGAWKETVLYSFRGAPNDGLVPASGVIFDAAGNLYGTTFNGGAYNEGVAYRITP